MINEIALDGQRKEKTMKNLLKIAALAALGAGIAHATKKSKRSRSKGGGRINCPKVMANEQSRIAARRMAGK